MMKIQKMPLSSLHAPAKNVRKHTDKQISEYVRSLQMFGQVKPIVIDDAGEIICGNGLFLALTEMGEAECDCYVMEGITEAQKKKLMLADNRVYELGSTDISIFEEIVHSLDGDVDVPGWDEELLATLNASLPDVDEMIIGYGSFEASYTDKVKDNTPPLFTREAATPSSTIPTSSEPLQPAFQPSHVAPQCTTAPNPEPPTAATETHTERWVVCPKCGERICL